ncbi:type VI secretion system-associated FHA domain protein TagH [Methylocaldum sp.]|uniref:type VI secretion system-associated FHA domain protein TagH n=1 Tax=Methylocaldum sp. TaxID=1969727 RepID=UPI002D28A5A1|nr:type VI secretion system-associated FHA domain protein TagH [Methylocaldum sp.]HYE34286.1 type VI secretion system-associated FHA domain protein TagH [Methylocaldum sp.]
MSLILKVLSYKGAPVREESSCTFDQQGGSVGRSPDNRFVLPDPDKFISRKHGSVDYRNGVYYFTDSSTAGTYFANKDLLLQHDAVPLSNGDVLKIGEYEIGVTEAGPSQIQPEEPLFDFDPFEQPPESPAPAVTEPAAWPEPRAERWDSPFDVLPPQPEIPQSSGPSFIDQPDVSPFHGSFIPPDVADKPEESGLPDFDLKDLLRDLDSSESGAGQQAPAPESWEPPDDFFQGLDWGDPVPDRIEPSSMPETELVDGSDMISDFPVEEGAALDKQASGSLPEGLMPSHDASEAIIPAISTPTGGDVADLQRPARPPNGPRPVPNKEPQGSSQVSGAAAGRDLFASFLAGAGLADDTEWIKDEDMAAVMKNVGVLLRDFVEGMMTVMRARAELKSQFRVSVTTMRPVNNNPLKFTPNVDDALKIMLARNHPGFVDPVEAVRGGFADLMSHQIAMTAGIQAALAAALKRFDPQGFEKLYEDAIVFQKKAKCWDAYGKAYPETVNEILENFFGEEFGEVYERQMRILQSAQSR